jgi:hypothetical protein
LYVRMAEMIADFRQAGHPFPLPTLSWYRQP